MNIVELLKKYSNSIFVCLFEILVGILLLINPVQFTSGIIIAAGVLLIIGGAIFVFKYFRADPAEAATSQNLLKGLIALAGGIFCVFKTKWFIDTFPILTILYGVAILVIGFGKVQWAADAMRLKTGRWGLPAASAVISIICAIAIILNPFESTVVLWMFTGASLIVEAIFDLIIMIFFERKVA